MRQVFLDFETRSDVDLKKAGAWNYARDPSTKILMLAYSVSPAKQISVWYPGKPFPPSLARAVTSGYKMIAWNAGFDRRIWEFVLANDCKEAPVPKVEQWHDAAAISRANGIPGKLERAVEFMFGFDEDLIITKYRGYALIKLFCVNHADPAEHPQEWDNFVRYCINDVAAMRTILYQCTPLSETMQRVYAVNDQINERGVLIDWKFATHAAKWKNDEIAEIKKEVSKYTGHMALQGANTIKWIYEQLPEHLRGVMHAENKTGFSLDESTRLELLDTSDLPATVYRVVELIQSAQSTSLAKYDRMSALADLEDRRVRDAFVFCGASTTGRFSSFGAQIHNLPRDCAPNPLEIREQVLQGTLPKAGAIKKLRSMLRPTLIAAPGHQFVSGDWSQIEGRVNPWLMAHPSAEQLLNTYRDSDRDVYLETAHKILGRPATDKTERLIYGKVPSLALGYGGGYRAFLSMAKLYNVESIGEIAAKNIVSEWRAQNSWATDWWDALEKTVVYVVQMKAETMTCGRLKVFWSSDFDGSLRIQLPSGRALTYPQAKLTLDKFDKVAVSFARSAFTPKKGMPWPRKTLWGGLLCENVTQAAAADVLMNTLLAEELQPYIVGHIHDEVLLEVPEQYAEHFQATLRYHMEELPAWADNLPIAAEVWSGPRYRK